jgi:hypothetical protein
MRQRRAPIITIAFIGALLIGVLIWGRYGSATIVLSREDLQREIDKAFPIEKQELIATITLSDPKVLLDEGSSRIGLEMTVSGSIPGVKQVTGHLGAEGVPRYEPATGSLYLDEPSILRLELPGVSAKDSDAAKLFLSPLFGPILARSPLYKLKDRRKVKSVRIENGTVRIELRSIFA